MLSNSRKNNTVLSTNQRLMNKINSRVEKKTSLNKVLFFHTAAEVCLRKTSKPETQNFYGPQDPSSVDLIKREKNILFRSVCVKKNNLTLNDKFINLLMKNGNKLKASQIFYDSLKILYFKHLNSECTLGNKKFTNIHSVQKKFDYSCNKKQFMNVSSSDKVTPDTHYTSQEKKCENSRVVYTEVQDPLFTQKQNSKVTEKFQSVLHAHKNSDKDFFLDNLVLPNANKLFIKAVENVKPSVETRNVKVSGMTYSVPAVIGKHRQQILAIRWLIECATKNKKNTSISFCECLASELYEASILSGKAKQKRDAMHKHAEYNRAYIRFKWW